MSVLQMGNIGSTRSGHSQMGRSMQHTQELLSPFCKAFPPLVCLIFDIEARLDSDCIRTHFCVARYTQVSFWTPFGSS